MAAGRHKRSSLRAAFISGAVLPMAELLTGGRFLKLRRTMEREQWRPLEENLAAQWPKATALLRHAYENVRFYHDSFSKAGITPDDIRTPADWVRLPVVRKTDIQSGRDSFMSKTATKRMLRPTLTSGSTGRPLLLFEDTTANDVRYASLTMFNGWMGMEPGDKLVMFMLPQKLTLRSRIWRKVGGIRLVPVGRVSAAEGASFAALLRSFRPAVIDGYPSYLKLVAEAMRAAGVGPGWLPRAVVCHSELLLDETRALLEETFQCPVFNRYGCVELSGMVAQTCEKRDGFHVNAYAYMVEVIKDGRPAGPSEIGRLILTDLYNYAFPLIRYDIGDYGCYGPPCACGRGLPVLSTIDGRETQFMRFPSGRMMSQLDLMRFIRRYVSGLLEYDFRQKAPDRLTIRVVPREGFGGDFLRTMRAGFEEFLGEGIAVSVEPSATPLPLEPSGKKFILKREFE